uniref:Uncharacterized protein n=1 Tax=Timema poppense TaxID=170557 RepID=A0A7R9DLU8_TIMPO|nr:unnamed protein product [Timema poppensis]
MICKNLCLAAVTSDGHNLDSFFGHVWAARREASIEEGHVFILQLSTSAKHSSSKCESIWLAACASFSAPPGPVSVSIDALYRSAVTDLLTPGCTICGPAGREQVKVHCPSCAFLNTTYSSPMASLVLTDLKSYQTKLCVSASNHLICKNMRLAAVAPPLVAVSPRPVWSKESRRPPVVTTSPRKTQLYLRPESRGYDRHSNSSRR